MEELPQKKKCLQSENIIKVCVWDVVYKFFEEYIQSLAHNLNVKVICYKEEDGTDLELDLKNWIFFIGTIPIAYENVLKFYGRKVKNICFINMEQLTRNSANVPLILSYYTKFPWIKFIDYCHENIKVLRGKGILPDHHFVLPPLSYSALSYPEEEKSIDVIFIGTMSAKRQHILNSLIQNGLNVCILSNVFGPSKVDLLARAKVLLNIKYAPEYQITEWLRCFPSIFNDQFVISDEGYQWDTNANEYKEKEPLLYSNVTFVPYESLVQEVIKVVREGTWRVTRTIDWNEYNEKHASALYEFLNKPIKD